MMSLSGFLYGNVHLLRNTLGSSSAFKLLKLQWDGNFNNVVSIGRYSVRPVIIKAVGRKGEMQGSKPEIKNLNIFNRKEISTAKLCPETKEIFELRSLQHQNTEQITADATRSSDWPAVVIVFDIETTGFGKGDRIIEVAFRDLLGGRNSTLQTLVNPEIEVKNSHIHQITTEMVCRPGVPRMKDLIPILIKYVESRRIDGKPVLLVAHNGRTFDIPFFKREFSRCSFEFPLDWMFIDTLLLARKLVKPDGRKPASLRLEALREHYQIPLRGPSHRAMQDVTTLCYVLQKMSFEFKLSVADLMEGAFRASDIPDRSKV